MRKQKRKVDVFVTAIGEDSATIRISILNLENEYLFVFPEAEIKVGSGRMVGDIDNPFDPRDGEETSKDN